MTTELRVLGREGRSGAVDVAVVEAAGLAAAGEVVVIAVEETGLPAVGVVESAFPANNDVSTWGSA